MLSPFLALIFTISTITLFGFSEVGSARSIDSFEVQLLKTGKSGETNFDYPNFYFDEQQTRAIIYYSFRRIEYWDIESAQPKLLRVSKSTDKEIHSVAFSKKTGLLAIGYNQSNLVEVIDPETNRLIMKFNWKSRSDKQEVRNLTFSDDGTLLAALSYHGEGVVFDILKRRVVQFDIGHFATEAAFSPDNSRLFAGARNSKVVEVPLKGDFRPKIITRLTGGNNLRYDNLFSGEDNHLILVLDPDAGKKTGGQFVGLDRNTGEKRLFLPVKSDNYQLNTQIKPAMIPNSDQFAMILNFTQGDRDSQRIGFWDSHTNEPRLLTKPISGIVTSLTASNSKIFAGLYNGDVMVFDINSGDLEARISVIPTDKTVNPNFQMNQCQYLLSSPTAENVLVGSANGYVMRLKIRH